MTTAAIGEFDPFARSVDDIDALAASLRYVDLTPLLGRAGIGLEYVDWGSVGLDAVLADPIGGQVAFFSWVGAPGDAAGGGLLASFESQAAMPVHMAMECETLAHAFPGPSEDGGWAGMLGLDEDMASDRRAALGRLLDRQRRLAREAVEAADLPDHMRAALHAFLDHGAPRRDGELLREVRLERGQGFWDYHGLIATHPLVGRKLLRDLDGHHDRVRSPDLASMMALTEPGLTPARMRRLAPYGREPGGPHPSSDGDWLSTNAALTVAGTVPPEWIPAPDHWETFAAVSTMAALVALGCGTSVADLLASSGGDWEGTLAAVRAARGLGPPGGVHPGTEGSDLAQDVEDALSNARSRVFLPAMANVLRPTSHDGQLDLSMDAFVAAQVALHGAKSLAGIARIAKRWHALRDTLDTSVLAGDASLSWPAMIGPLDLPGGIRVVPIADSVSLSEEGARGKDRQGMAGLDHCVATRLHHYVSGSAHLLSIRSVDPDGTWTRLSTLEVGLTPDGKVAVSQHRSHGNGGPCRRAETAMLAVVDGVADGRIPLRVDPVERREAPLGDDLVTNMCGYDWRDADAVTEVMAAWAPLLPRWLRGLDPEGFVQALRERGLDMPAGPEAPSV